MHAHSRRLNQAETTQAGGLIGIGAVDRDTAGHRQSLHLPLVDVHKAFRTRAQNADVVHQPMPCQILQSLGHAIALQIRRAGAIDHGEVTQVSRHHRLVRLGADAQHAIEPFGEQIDPAVGAADFQLKQRVLRHERRQARHHHATGENVRQVDANAPHQRRLVLAKQALDFVHV
ncbi:hypothetical protein D3C87_1506900 [compost metagenome]